jgi:NCAIR mutase (PurE)-related protein
MRDVLTEINKNPRMRPLIPVVANIGLKMMAENIGISAESTADILIESAVIDGASEISEQDMQEFINSIADVFASALSLTDGSIKDIGGLCDSLGAMLDVLASNESLYGKEKTEALTALIFKSAAVSDVSGIKSAEIDAMLAKMNEKNVSYSALLGTVASTADVFDSIKNGSAVTSDQMGELVSSLTGQGAGEVIYGAGKTAEQIIGISRRLIDGGANNVLITRLDADKAEILCKNMDATYDPVSKIAIAAPQDQPHVGNIVVATGGTSDMPVAEEAALTAETLGSHVVRLYDVGVAGLHRLLSHLDQLQSARVVVAIAGMEGALASVLGGLVDCPVIAVPTSVGYGASFGGLAALLSMLNSCASGCSVVNIDNGFGAGFLAHRINTMEGIKR